jgi:hypothetical protein
LETKFPPTISTARDGAGGLVRSMKRAPTVTLPVSVSVLVVAAAGAALEERPPARECCSPA